MKSKFLPCLLTVFALATAFSANADQITVGGTSRTYIKYVPNQLGENRPLLISMHGMNQDANYQRGMLQIESIADTAKFAVVFPEGINRSWDISGTSDIDFVLEIIDDMATKHGIDKKRVYLSGFSMGGMFTYHAMNHIADRIAAFAPISGYPMGGQPFTSSRPVPIIHTHGTGDDVVAYSGVQRSLDGWIARNGCSPTPIITDHYRTNIARRYQWGPGDDGVEVVLLELADKGHWISNDGFYTGEEIWNFCSRYSLETNLPKVTIKRPLPKATYMTLGAPNEHRVDFEAIATSPDSEIASVTYYCDNTLVGEVTEAPYVFDWTNAINGTYQLKVVATDVNGKSSARATQFTVKSVIKNQNISSTFKTNGSLPADWVSYDGRVVRVGEAANVSGTTRVVQFTGSPRDFNYGLLVHNVTGADDAGYAAYADQRGSLSMLLPVGTFEVTYKACLWNADGQQVRCCVVDAETDEVIAEASCVPQLNLGGKSDQPFSGATEMSVLFGIDYSRLVKIVFYADAVKKSSVVVGDIMLKKVSSQGITDMTADHGTVAKVTYIDMYGRTHAHPVQGLMLRRTVYTDGTIVTDKIIK